MFVIYYFGKYGMWQMSAYSFAVHEALNVLIDDPPLVKVSVSVLLHLQRNKMSLL